MKRLGLFQSSPHEIEVTSGRRDPLPRLLLEGVEDIDGLRETNGVHRTSRESPIQMTGFGSRPDEMSRENGARPISGREFAELLSNSMQQARVGGENLSLVDFVRFTEENSQI